MRFLGKKEVFDAPVVGDIAKAMGGIRVDRGTGSDEPLEAAAEASARLGVPAVILSDRIEGEARFASGRLYIDMDGDGRADHAIALPGVRVLTADDLIL